MTNEQLFNIAFLHGDLEKVSQSLKDYNSGLISRNQTIEECLLALKLIDKPLSPEVAKYEKRGRKMLEKEINQIIKPNQ